MSSLPDTYNPEKNLRWEDFEEEEKPDPESADARSQELQRRLDTLKQLIDARAEDYEDGAFC